MRIGEGARLPPESLVGADEMRAAPRPPARRRSGRARPRPRSREVRAPARRPAACASGFITGTTDTYCGSCDRLRVASDGMLRPCLATNDGVAAMSLAAAGDVDGIVGAIAEAWSLKPDGETWKGCTEPTAAAVSMRAIGG